MRVCSAPILLVLALLATPVAPALAGTLLVANKTDNTVDLVDSDTGESVATLPTGHGPHEVAVSRDGGTAVISNYGDRSEPGSSLTVLDLERREVVRTIELDDHTRPHGLDGADTGHPRNHSPVTPCWAHW